MRDRAAGATSQEAEHGEPLTGAEDEESLSSGRREQPSFRRPMQGQGQEATVRSRRGQHLKVSIGGLRSHPGRPR